MSSTFSTAPELERELDRVPAAADVMVDVSEARVADGAALRVRRCAAERLRRQGNELTVVCERQPVARTLLRASGRLYAVGCCVTPQLVDSQAVGTRPLF